MFNSMLGKLTGNNSNCTGASDAAKAKQFEDNLIELQKRCEPIFSADPAQTHNEKSLRRFLRGYVMVDAAFNGILKYNKWRKEYGVDDMKADDPDIQAEFVLEKVHILRNRDVKGRPILHIAVRKHLTNDRDLDRLTKFTIYMLELAYKRLDEDVIDNICIVFDMTKFSHTNMDYQFVKKLIWLLGKYYPERLGVCIVYCAPLMFQGCWTVIRPWLNEVTASKVVFVANEEQLCQYMNPDALPPVEI